MTSLKQRRRKTIQTLVEWLKPQIPKILRELRQQQFWNNNVVEGSIVGYVTFDELDEYKQQFLLGRRVRGVLLAHIRREYMFSHATEYSYVQAVMYKVGCFYDDRHRCWLCEIPR